MADAERLLSYERSFRRAGLPLDEVTSEMKQSFADRAGS